MAYEFWFFYCSIGDAFSTFNSTHRKNNINPNRSIDLSNRNNISFDSLTYYTWSNVSIYVIRYWLGNQEIEWPNLHTWELSRQLERLSEPYYYFFNWNDEITGISQLNISLNRNSIQNKECCSIPPILLYFYRVRTTCQVVQVHGERLRQAYDDRFWCTFPQRKTKFLTVRGLLVLI